MKRVIVILMAAAMLLLPACGAQSDADVNVVGWWYV